MASNYPFGILKLFLPIHITIFLAREINNPAIAVNYFAAKTDI
jgi:hypothetical protein